MQQTLAALYPWLKAGHIIFVVFWMAGLFMLPRQMLYCASATPNSAEEALWAERMGKLRGIILTPSLVITWLLGLATAPYVGRGARHRTGVDRGARGRQTVLSDLRPWRD